VKGEKIDAENKSIDSMWKQLPHTADEERAQILLELAQDAVERNSGDEALALAEEARGIYQSLGASVPNVEVAKSIFGIGSALKQLHREKEAAELLNEAIALQRESGFPYLPDTYRIQGQYFLDAKDYESAVKSYLEAAQVDEVDGDDEFLAVDFFNVGRSYFYWEKYEEAIGYFKKTRGILKKRRDLFGISWSDHFIAESYLKLGSAEAALASATSAYAIGELRKHNEMLCKGAFTKAKAHMMLGDFDQVSKDLGEADYLASASCDWDLMVEIQEEYRKLHVNLNQFEDAAKVEARIKTIREILE
jgi:tetratricopeptide (TPR) repeat protein